jgi:hypothetical protein
VDGAIPDVVQHASGKEQSIMFQYIFMRVTLRTLLEQQEPGDTDKKENQIFLINKEFRVEQLHT